MAYMGSQYFFFRADCRGLRVSRQTNMCLCAYANGVYILNIYSVYKDPSIKSLHLLGSMVLTANSA